MRDLKTSEWLSLGTALVFLLTVVYAYGYSLKVNINLFMFFTLNDYFRLAIEWLLPVALPGGFAWLLGRMRAALRKEDDTATLEHAQRIPAHLTKSRELLFSCIYTGLALVMATILYKLGEYLIMVATFVLLALIIGMQWTYWALRERGGKQWSPQVSLLITAIPLLFGFAFYEGIMAAGAGYRVVMHGTDTRVFLSDPSEELKGRVHFLLDDWVIAREDLTDQLRIIPKSRVRLIIHDD